MRGLSTAAALGGLFGVGLVISGMTRADKVIGFLDLFGDWDPTLAFVMVGAIGVHLPLRILVKRRAAPLMAETFEAPTRTTIDARLVAGALLFGVGWGVSGYCPGPGIASLVPGGAPALVFCGTMALGMAGHHLLFTQSARGENDGGG